MNFEKPDSVTAMDNMLNAVDVSGECEDVIGAPLEEGVTRTVPEYDRKLSFGLNPAAEDKRGEVEKLAWGRIEKDAARLNGLGAAMENKRSED